MFKAFQLNAIMGDIVEFAGAKDKTPA